MNCSAPGASAGCGRNVLAVEDRQQLPAQEGDGPGLLRFAETQVRAAPLLCARCSSAPALPTESQAHSAWPAPASPHLSSSTHPGAQVGKMQVLWRHTAFRSRLELVEARATRGASRFTLPSAC